MDCFLSSHQYSRPVKSRYLIDAQHAANVSSVKNMKKAVLHDLFCHKLMLLRGMHIRGVHKGDELRVVLHRVPAIFRRANGHGGAFLASPPSPVRARAGGVRRVLRSVTS